jgi:hypothetical protein
MPSAAVVDRHGWELSAFRSSDPPAGVIGRRVVHHHQRRDVARIEVRRQHLAPCPARRAMSGMASSHGDHRTNPQRTCQRARTHQVTEANPGSGGDSKHAPDRPSLALACRHRYRCPKHHRTAAITCSTASSVIDEESGSESVRSEMASAAGNMPRRRWNRSA